MDENAQPVHNPHDRFFKETFSHPETAGDFFRTCLPARLVEAIDWQSLELTPNTFIDERLSERSSDLLYSVRLRDRPVLVYCLFEHQSTVDPNMPFRLLVYMVRIWEHWCRVNPGERPPCIVPLVLYQGTERWGVSPRFVDWLGLSEEFKTDLIPFAPNFEHVLFDLSQAPLKQLRARAELKLALSLMQAVVEGDLERWLTAEGSRLAALLSTGDNAAEFFRRLMYYAFAAGDLGDEGASTVERLAGRIKDNRVKERVMSIAEKLRQEGRQEGREKGLQEGREKGLQEGAYRGQIQLCQRILGVAVMSTHDLEQLSVAEQQELLTELQARLQQRLREQ